MTAPDRIWVDFEPTDWPTERIMYGNMEDPYIAYVRADLFAELTEQLAAARKDADEAEAYAWELEALLREARIDLEHYVTHEYPKHLHPYYERQWNRDMELCRRIDAALKGADHE